MSRLICPFEPNDVEDARTWAKGFVDAMAVCPEIWDRLDATSEVDIKTIPIRLLDVEDEDAKAKMAETLGRSFEQLEQAAIAAIEASVLALNRHAKKVRGPLALHDTAPGRNDPCICGSGKKYKKCCGR